MKYNGMEIRPELRELAKSCKTPEDLQALVKKEGIKLTEEEPEVVAGGWPMTWSQFMDDCNVVCSANGY